MKIFFMVLMFVLGAVFGSFLCCQARRLRLKETKKSPLGSRSVCNHCHYRLSWYDNIPIVSWLILHGKCRKCHKKIGVAEILCEVGLALGFLGVASTFNIETAKIIDWFRFSTLMIFIINISFLAIYDGLYGEFPSIFLWSAIFIAIVLIVIDTINLGTNSMLKVDSLALNLTLSIAILGGLYLLLYLISKGKWVGDGDWLLGVALATALCKPWLCLVLLFLANLLACIVALPSYKKIKKQRISFGPFLVSAFFIVYTFANYINNMI